MFLRLFEQFARRPDSRRSLYRGQQQRHQHADNCDYDQELNKRKKRGEDCSVGKREHRSRWALSTRQILLLPRIATSCLGERSQYRPLAGPY